MESEKLTSYETPTLSEEDEFLVERLVDDELSEDERAELLLKLDETLDGWRFTALTFLEAQTFRSSMKNLSGAKFDSSTETSSASPHVKQSTRGVSRVAALGRYALSTAAGALVAVAALAGLHRFQTVAPNPRSEGEFSIAQGDKLKTNAETKESFNNAAIGALGFKEPSSDDRAFENADALARSDDNSAFFEPDKAVQSESLALDATRAADDLNSAFRRGVNGGMALSGMGGAMGGGMNLAMSAPSPQPAAAQPGGLLQNNANESKTLTLNSPLLGLSNVSVPFAESRDVDPRAFYAENAVMPQEVVDHIRNVGGRVEAKRNLYRFPLDDGRVLILPVDDYNLDSDSNRPIW